MSWRTRRGQKILCLIAMFWLSAAGLIHSAEVVPGTDRWQEYRTIMWVGDTARDHPQKLRLFCQRLKEMGINTGMVYGEGPPEPLVENQMPYYVENIVNRGLCLKFNSTVRDWDRFVTDWANTGRKQSALVRDYCLDDPMAQFGAKHYCASSPPE